MPPHALTLGLITLGAAIVCVSGNGQETPDPALRLWGQSWAVEKSAHPCMLVALLSQGENSTGRLTEYLRQLAGKKHAEFFLGSGQAVEQQYPSTNHKPATMNL